MEVKQIFKKVIPHFVKRWVQNINIKFKYGVNIGSGSHVHKTDFGKFCSVGKGSKIFASVLGRSTYIANNTSICFARIGKFCAIGDNVQICLGNHPTKKFVSIHPCFYSHYGEGTPSYQKKEIFSGHKYIEPEAKYVVEIGNDVWIGNDVRILDGIKIGDGAIIGVGSIVTTNVKPFSIVVGIPARHIRYRFTEEERKFLLKFCWWDNTDEWFYDIAEFFTDIEKFKKRFIG